MKKSYLSFIYFLCLTNFLFCQEVSTDDTLQAKEINEVIVRAFEQNRHLSDVPASVNYISNTALNRYSPVSILSAVNATAGARMEERSPGSYRLNIRGSSLRSPFGVRNVKIYYNNVPFTDPGGNTYLNQLGFYNFGSIEILKGPGSSLYGAGTGGVMLIQSNGINKSTGINLSHTIGSYNLQNSNININTGSDSFRSIINYQHQISSGYREHSALRRDILSWEVTSKIKNTDQLTATFLLGDLFYETPGALNLKEYQQNNKAARPKVGQTPGALESKAAIYQKTFLGGLSYQKSIDSNWKNTSIFYGAFSRLDNPAIRNYARNNQPHFGGRTVFEFKKMVGLSEVIWHTGGEIQSGFTTVKTYKNNQGNTDSLLSDDEINVSTYFAFTQLSYNYKNWIGVAGLSYNRAKYGFKRFNNIPATDNDLDFKNQLAPRISLLNKLTPKLSIYLSWSRGFSPPTTEEIFPSGSLANPGLAAEQGINYEIGIKGSAFKNRLTYDISSFYFQLNNTIVQRRDAAGGDFYTNAGATSQKGIETQLSYRLISNAIATASIWMSHTYYDFYYKNFKQVNDDFSNKAVPGVARHFITSGIDVNFRNGIYGNLTYQYSDPVALNDANTAYSEPYNLLSAKVGYKHSFSRITAGIFAGADNIFDVNYSLGNDINAFGGRYYNAAPGRNFFLGLTLNFDGKTKE